MNTSSVGKIIRIFVGIELCLGIFKYSNNKF